MVRANILILFFLISIEVLGQSNVYEKLFVNEGNSEMMFLQQVDDTTVMIHFVKNHTLYFSIGNIFFANENEFIFRNRFPVNHIEPFTVISDFSRKGAVKFNFEKAGCSYCSSPCVVNVLFGDSLFSLDRYEFEFAVEDLQGVDSVGFQVDELSNDFYYVRVPDVKHCSYTYYFELYYRKMDYSYFGELHFEVKGKQLEILNSFYLSRSNLFYLKEELSNFELKQLFFSLPEYTTW